MSRCENCMCAKPTTLLGMLKKMALIILEKIIYENHNALKYFFYFTLLQV